MTDITTIVALAVTLARSIANVFITKIGFIIKWRFLTFKIL